MKAFVDKVSHRLYFPPKFPKCPKLGTPTNTKYCSLGTHAGAADGVLYYD